MSALLLASDHFQHGRYGEAIALWQRLLDEERPRINRAALIQRHPDRPDHGWIGPDGVVRLMGSIFPQSQ